MKYRYFDCAATTRVDDEIAAIISKYNGSLFYNASANYAVAASVHHEIDGAREGLLNALKGFNGTLYFVSSGTEGDNQALFCSKKRRNANIVISAAEHPAIYNTANALKNSGFELRICPVDSFARVNEAAFAELVDIDTALVSVMHVNNETGGINDIKKLVSIAKRKSPAVIFHSDGVQAFGKVPVNLSDLGVDLYTISGHKIGAPKGIAALYVKKGISIAPLLYGGGQESGLRSSTENVSGIMSFAFAAKRAQGERQELEERYRAFSNVLKDRLSEIEEIQYLSDEKCSAHIFTFAFKSVRGEVMQHALESVGFLVGTGSACSSTRAHERIPKALGLKEYSDGVIRISFGRENTMEEVQELAAALVENYNVLKKYVGR